MPELIWVISQELDGKPVRQAAMRGMGLSGGLFKRAKFHGSVLLDGQPVLADARVLSGQELRIFIPEKQNDLPKAVAMPLKVVYEDQHLMMVDKPAPLPSSSSFRKEAPTLENAVFLYAGCPSDFVYRPVNRLDKGTSGLMVVAKTAYGQHLMQQLLHTDRFIREYLAVVEGKLEKKEGSIDFPIAKAEGSTVKRQVSAGGKPALTHYRVLKESGGRSLVRLRLETGRTHQIRVHLSACGCPVSGDFLYGTELPSLPGRFALHSACCRFQHPLTGQWIHRESELPPELVNLL